MKNKLCAAGAIIALALAGCSDTAGDADASNTASGSTSATGLPLHGTYNNVDELKAAVTDKGYACETPQELGWNQISCDGDDVLGVFPNHGSTTAYIHRTEKTAEEPFLALVGDNWLVIGKDAELEKLQAELGGEIASYGQQTAEESN
ncbi:hypothetical protein [Trueperella bialowiezensis]|uniref:Lipoprotein n=1 Tax=Trueperella bialowiezensis TaxID=312285 RepID=A0A3S4WGP6_9ACTO|nr:hypothetical protein [Trueperella bialowiezensis]VEI13510.1 Uncharacterised protein [Trueperella bialowiezensis]